MAVCVWSCRGCSQFKFRRLKTFQTQQQYLKMSMSIKTNQKRSRSTDKPCKEGCNAKRVRQSTPSEEEDVTKFIWYLLGRIRKDHITIAEPRKCWSHTHEGLEKFKKRLIEYVLPIIAEHINVISEDKWVPHDTPGWPHPTYKTLDFIFGLKTIRGCHELKEAIVDIVIPVLDSQIQKRKPKRRRKTNTLA